MKPIPTITRAEYRRAKRRGPSAPLRSARRALLLVLAAILIYQWTNAFVTEAERATYADACPDRLAQIEGVCP
jgi:hypothetical protein